jgi:hypothetical protein
MRRLAAFSGRMQISIRCRPYSAKQASVASATAVGVIPFPANRSLTQYPIVAEHSDPRATPHTLS